MTDVTIYSLIKPYLAFASPIIFGVGIILIIAPASYKKLEEVLNEEVGGIRKRIFPLLENAYNNFHHWVLIKTNTLGITCVIIAIIFYILSNVVY